MRTIDPHTQNRPKLEKIKDFFNAGRYSMVDFWCATSYEPTELVKRNKHREIVEVRQVGLVWAVLSGLTFQKAADLFERDHATAVHSVNCILSAIENPKMYKTQYELLLRIADISTNKLDISSDQHTNMQRMMDYCVQPLLNIVNPTGKVAVNVINNRVHQLKIAI